jgi:hypothetical protein
VKLDKTDDNLLRIGSLIVVRREPWARPSKQIG